MSNLLPLFPNPRRSGPSRASCQRLVGSAPRHVHLRGANSPARRVCMHLVKNPWVKAFLAVAVSLFVIQRVEPVRRFIYGS